MHQSEMYYRQVLSVGLPSLFSTHQYNTLKQQYVALTHKNKILMY